MKKILFLFLSLSVCNSYASIEQDNNAKKEEAKYTDLTALMSPSCSLISSYFELQMVPQEKQSAKLSGEYTKEHLEKLTPEGCVDWIKKHVKDQNAIKAVTEFAKDDFEKWGKIRVRLLDGSKNWKRNKKKRLEFVSSVDREIIVTNFLKEQERLSMRFAKYDELERKYDELKEEIIYSSSQVERLEQRLQAETERREALESEITELREQVNKPVAQSELTLAELSDVAPETQNAELVASQIDELKKQMDDLKGAISVINPDIAGKIQGLSDSLDLSKTVQNLSEKVATDLESMKAQLVELDEAKAGVHFTKKFSVLLQSLIDAQKKESKKGRFITVDEWKQIIADNKEKRKKQKQKEQDNNGNI